MTRGTGLFIAFTAVIVGGVLLAASRPPVLVPLGEPTTILEPYLYRRTEPRQDECLCVRWKILLENWYWGHWTMTGPPKEEPPDGRWGFARYDVNRDGAVDMRDIAKVFLIGK